jgi:tetratricopeptide (TPR) repeat protein
VPVRAQITEAVEMERSIEEPSAVALSSTLAAVAAELPRDAEKVLSGAVDTLEYIPGQPQALLLLTSALKLIDDPDLGPKLLAWMAARYPKLAALQYELALTQYKRGERDAAIETLNRVVQLEPGNAAAWRLLGNQLSAKGDRAAAAAAFERHSALSLTELKLVEETIASGKEAFVKAEIMLLASLEVNSTDVASIRLLGMVYTKLGDYLRARMQFTRALELVPSFSVARNEYAEVLQLAMKWRESIEQFEILSAADPGNPHYKARIASNLVMLGEADKAFELLDEVRPQLANNPVYWVNRGNNLRMAGRGAESVDAYRTCLEVDPDFGAAWWGLANLKTYRFSQADIEKMFAALNNEDLEESQQIPLEFALGQALEHEKRYAESFDHYSKANVLRRKLVHHDADVLSVNVRKLKAVFTPEFFRKRTGSGCPARDPIFIVGMVRAGSSLVEQILSSHSEVEGTMELPEMTNLVTSLSLQWPNKSYPELLADMDDAALRALGEEYLAATRHHRHLGRPFFTDKAGANLWRVGLIQLILPNAKIIDARRHPLGCCFSAFKQDFPVASTAHSYDMTELGRYYRSYVDAMAHFDNVLPGRVHRVFHEDMIRDPDTEIRRLLAYCELPFEESCLRFYETDRSVRTFSSEQVRKPVSAGSSEQWRHYERWLGPLKDALGDVLTLYPGVPEFDATRGR